MKREEKNKTEKIKPVNIKTKKKEYFILIGALILLVLGLFIGFYTLTSSINLSSISGSLGECVKYRYDPSKLKYRCSNGTLEGAKCKIEDEGIFNLSCPKGYEKGNTTQCPNGMVGNNCYKCKKTIYEDATAYACEQGKLVDTRRGKSCQICDEYEYESAKRTSTTKKTATTKQKQLSISCYIKKDEKRIDIKDEGQAYVNKYVYCKTNQKGVSWKIDGVKESETKLYEHSVRFKINKIKSSVKITVSKNGYKSNQTAIKVANYCDAKITSSKDNTIKVSTNCNNSYSLSELYLYSASSGSGGSSDILKGINEYKDSYGEKKTDYVNVTKGKYKVKLVIKDKNGKTKTVSKTVSVKGKYYTNTFNLASIRRCTISNEKIENGKYSSNVKCGKDANLLNETALVNKTTNKEETLSGASGYGTEYAYSKSKINNSDEYRLRVYYTVRNSTKEYGMDKYVVTTERNLKVYCPSVVKTKDRFICYIKKAFEGGNIEITNSNNKKLSSNNKKTIRLKSSKEQELKVKATYKKQNVNKTIKVKNDTSKEKIQFACSTRAVKANKKFYCSSTIEGVKITISNSCDLNKGYNKSFTTSFDKNNFKYLNYFSCSKKGEVTVTATKSGYEKNTYKITVK